MDHGEDGDHFLPVALEEAAVRGAVDGFCAEGDLAKGVLGGPVEEEVAVEPADGVLSAVSAIEPDAGEHDIGAVGLDKLAGLELCNDVFPAVAKF